MGQEEYQKGEREGGGEGPMKNGRTREKGGWMLRENE